MRLTLPAIELATLLKTLASTVQPNSPMPILGHVLLEAVDGRLSATTTTLSMQSAFSCSAVVDEPGRVCAEHKPLLAFAERVRGDVVIAPGDRDELRLTAGSARLRQPTLDAATFPLADPVDAEPFELDAAELRRALEVTASAAGGADYRPYLGGVYLEPGGTCTATDGFRLAQAPLALPASLPPVIVPGAAVHALLRLLPAEGGVTLAVTPAAVALAWEDRTFRAQTLEGPYPDYQRVIPELGPLRARADRGELSRAVGLIAAVSELEKNGRGVVLKTEAGRLRLTARGASGRVVEEAIDALGDALTFGLNISYLQDILTGMTGAVIEVAAVDAAHPVRLLDPDEPATTHVLMPMRVAA